MSSFMDISNQRMDNLQVGIKNNFKAIKELSNTLSCNLDHFQLIIENTTEILVNQIDIASRLRTDFNNLQASVLALIQGN